MTNGGSPTFRRFPEHPPLGAEMRGRDAFKDLIAEQTLIKGVSAVDFVRTTLEQMLDQKLELTEDRALELMQMGFGSREDLGIRIAGKTSEELEDIYPGIVGVLIKWYLEPPEEK